MRGDKQTLNNEKVGGNNKILLVDLQYFSPLIFFLKLGTFSHCIFEQYETYEKMSFRNRCTLLGGNGPTDLSIPLVGGRGQRTLMKDVRIDNSDSWQSRHWKTITACYNKSPWFDFYRDELASIYQQRFELLIDWNIKCFEWICDKMAIKTGWSLTSSYIKKYDDDDVLDWRNRLRPSTINSLFHDAKPYPQVFGDRFGFVPNLSILDYLFCVGNKR